MGSCWASVRKLVGRECLAASAAQSKVITSVVIRFRPGITSSDTLNHEGRIDNIVSVIDVRSANDELVQMCNR